MPAPTVPLTDEQLAEIRAELERTTHPEWLAHTTVGQLLAEVERLRAEVADMAEDVATLRALEAAGVDNWEGYADA